MDETIDEYLQRGGAIKSCPPAGSGDVGRRVGVVRRFVRKAGFGNWLVWIEFGACDRIAARQCDSPDVFRRPQLNTRVSFEIKFEGAARFATKLTAA